MKQENPKEEPKQETLEEDDTTSDYDITPNIKYGNNVGTTIKIKVTIKSINIEDTKCQQEFKNK